MQIKIETSCKNIRPVFRIAKISKIIVTAKRWGKKYIGIGKNE